MLAVGQPRGRGEAAFVLAIALVGDFFTGSLLPQHLPSLAVQTKHSELVDFAGLGSAHAAASASATRASWWVTRPASSLGAAKLRARQCCVQARAQLFFAQGAAFVGVPVGKPLRER